MPRKEIEIQKEKIVELFINALVNRGLTRLITQQDDAKEISGATNNHTMSVMEGADWVWYKGCADEGGLPAPVARLLKQVALNGVVKE